MSRITFTSKLVNGRVNEGSAFTLTASFFNDDTDVWSAVTPTTARYRIDRVNGDPTCSSEVLAWTTLTPATSNSIAITGPNNAITDECVYEEPRQVIVEANAGLATAYEATYQYRVKNLAAVS